MMKHINIYLYQYTQLLICIRTVSYTHLAGDLLVEFDIDAIKKAGYPTITPIIITNTDNYEDVDTIKKGDVKEKDKLVSVR